jgi:hypothetical protein
VRRYQHDATGSSARIDTKPFGANAESGTAHVVEADPVTLVEITPLDVDPVTEPPQEGMKSPKEVNGTAQSTKDDDLFGDGTTSEPASAMSPPRY